MDKKLEKGELTFLFLLLAFSLFWLWQSLLVFLKDVGVATEGFFPFACSVVMTIMCLISIFEVRKYHRPFEKSEPIVSKIKETIAWLLPIKIVLAFLLILSYALLLKTVGFLIMTLLYLFGAMVVLHPKKLLKSGIIAVIVVAFIYIVFQFIFKVRLPKGFLTFL